MYVLNPYTSYIVICVYIYMYIYIYTYIYIHIPSIFVDVGLPAARFVDGLVSCEMLW